MASGFTGKATLCSLLALSAMESMATKDLQSLLVLLDQQPYSLTDKQVAQLLLPQSSQTQPNRVMTAQQLGMATATIPALLPPQFTSSSEVSSKAGLQPEPTPHSSLATYPHGASQPTEHSFRDLKTHWSQPFVELLAVKGIVSGYGDGTFQPERQIRAVDFSTMLREAKRYRLIAFRREMGFEDTLAQDLGAVASSLVTPTTEAESLIREHRLRTRAQAAVFIYRSLQAPVIGGRLEPQSPSISRMEPPELSSALLSKQNAREGIVGDRAQNSSA